MSLSQNLKKFGFCEISPNVLVLFGKTQITVEIFNEEICCVYSNCSDISKENEDVCETLIQSFNAHQITVDELVSNIVTISLKSVETVDEEDDVDHGFTLDDEEEIDWTTTGYVPVVEHKPLRKLKIYTWGIARRQRPPNDSQKNFNAGVLNGKKPGVNIKKLDGRSTDVQEVVLHSKRFTEFMRMTVEAIETNNYSVISINCTKGRHRSVGCTELLKKHFYPMAEIVHLEL